MSACACMYPGCAKAGRCLAASGGRDDHQKPLPVYYRTENAVGKLPAVSHCQNGGDVCWAGNHDGVCCPEDSCDIDDGMRKPPN